MFKAGIAMLTPEPGGTANISAEAYLCRFHFPYRTKSLPRGRYFLAPLIGIMGSKYPRLGHHQLSKRYVVFLLLVNGCSSSLISRKFSHCLIIRKRFSLWLVYLFLNHQRCITFPHFRIFMCQQLLCKLLKVHLVNCGSITIHAHVNYLSAGK